MDTKTLSKVAWLAFWGSFAGAVVSINFGASPIVSFITACIAAVVTAYSCDPLAANKVLNETFNSKSFYLAITKKVFETFVWTLLIVAFYASLLGCSFILLGRDAISFGGLVQLPMAIIIISLVILFVLAAIYSDVYSFEEAASKGIYSMPLNRFLSGIQGAIAPYVGNDIFLAFCFILLPYITLCYLIVTVFTLAIDIPITILMATAKEARIAIIVGVFPGVIIASWMFRLGLTEAHSVVYGAFIGSAISTASYVLREILATVPLGLSPSFVKK